MNKDTVLVVDDSPDTLAMLNDALEVAGMTALVSLDGKNAINLARKIKPNIILLDAIMPNLNGYETCMRLKQDLDTRGIPIIFMTGLTDSESVVKAFEYGGVDFVTKPIKPDELIARIRVHLTTFRNALSAHTALDTAGQHIIALDKNNDIAWATPQTQSLFESAGIREDWLHSKLYKQLEHWLNGNPKENDSLPVKLDSSTIRFIFLETEDETKLLKIIDEEKPDSIEILKHCFSLTQREAEVLLWIAKGKTNRDIAQIMEISPRTVNKHLEQIFPKLGVENRTTAAAKAIGRLS